MFQKIVFINLFPIFFVTLVWADSITMTVDSDRVSVGESISLQVVVEGFGRNSDISLTQVNDFEVQKSGTSSQINIINGKMSSSTISQFVLYPKKAGKFLVGPAEIEHKGAIHKSNVIEITVNAETPTVQKANAPYYVQASVDRNEVMIGEPIIYTFQLFTKLPMAISGLSELDAPSFYKEELEKPHEYQKILNGIPWNVVEFKKILYPLKSGTMTLGATVLTAMVREQGQRRQQNPFGSLFDDSDIFAFGGRKKRVQLQTQPITVNIQPLPETGKPSSFSGLIGQFTLETQIDKHQLKVGDSATLTLTFRGKGNLKDFVIPEVRDERLKIYDDEPVFDFSKEDGSQTKVFKRAIVPTQDGQIEIPPLKIDYFDSQKQSYASLQMEPITLQVSPNADESQLKHIDPTPTGDDQKKKISVTGTDIFPIKQVLKNSNPPISDSERLAFLLFLALTPLCYLLPWGLKRRLDEQAGNLGLKRRSRAFKDFHEAKKKLREAPITFDKLSIILRDYLGNKLDIDGRALTSSDVGRRLESSGISKTVALEIEALIKEFEAGQYGGKSITSSDHLLDRTEKIVQAIERELK